MVPLTSLWIPILGSAVLVFAASSLLHMVLPFHKNDLRRVPKEDEIMNALRRFHLPPGDYFLPHAGSHDASKSPEFVEKMQKGPVILMTVLPSGPPAMGTSLALWFGYAIVVGVFAAYIAGRALEPGAHYLAVFRFAGATAFVGYSLALLQHSIWYKRNWGTTLRSMADGLVYGLLTGGMFGWLWP
jgi:hypothetical protein